MPVYRLCNYCVHVLVIEELSDKLQMCAGHGFEVVI